MPEAKHKTELVIDCGGMNVVVQVVTRVRPVRGRILFVNGAIATLSALRWAEHSLDDFELVMFDFPLVGLSAPLNPTLERITRGDEFAIVRTIIEQFAPDYVISMSWGGAAALRALAERPPSVKRAIVASFSYGVNEALAAMSQSIFAFTAAGDFEAGACAAVSGLGEHLPARMQTSLKRYFRDLDRRQVEHILSHMQEVSALDAEDNRPWLRAIDIPVLFANGAEDRFTPPEGVIAFAAEMKAAKFAVAAGAGHFLAIESRAVCEETCAIVRGYFQAPALSRTA